MSLLNKKPVNPEAARLANHYVPLIRRQCGWFTPHSQSQNGTVNQKVTGDLPKEYQETAKVTEELFRGASHESKNFQESAKEWELDEEDIKALEEIPL